MSTRDILDSSLATKRLVQRRVPIPTPPTVVPWVRNPAWLALPTVLNTDNKFVGLCRIDNDTTANYVALSAAGDYTVNWGDGSATENISSTVVAQHQYDYSAAGLVGSDAPVTFQDAGDTVTRASHGYIDGNTVQFYNIVSTTGITTGATYYVITAATNTFQISLTSGGTAVALATNGTGALLPFKQAIVTVIADATPSAVTFNDALNTVNKTNHGLTNGLIVSFPTIVSTTGISINTPYYVITAGASTFQLSLTLGGIAIGLVTNGSGTMVNIFNNINLDQKYTLLNANRPVGWMAIAMAGTSLTTITLTQVNVTYGYLQQANIVNCVLASAANLFINIRGLCSVLNFVSTATITNFSGMFSGCYMLQTVPLFNTASGTNFNVMFSTCTSLTTVPLYNMVSATTAVQMFYQCSVLTDVPAFNAPVCTVFNYMFANCLRLQTIALGSTSSGQDFSLMFNVCNSLQTVSLFDTSSGTNFASMFNGCGALQAIPLFNTASGTSFNSTFLGCSALTAIPLLNLASATTVQAMFSGCTALTSVPLLNTASVSIFQDMFTNCLALTVVPLFNMTSATSATQMFLQCSGLNTVPAFNAPICTNFGYMFYSCTALVDVGLINTASGTNFTYMFGLCTMLEEVPLLNTGAGITFTSMFSGCKNLTTIPLLNTSSGNNFSGMVTNCTALTTIPLINTAGGTTFASMFSGCTALTSVPLLNTVAATTVANMFTNCVVLTVVPLFNLAATTSINQMFYQCGSLTSFSATLTSCLDYQLAFGSCLSLVRVSGSISAGTTYSNAFATSKILKLFKFTGLKASLDLSVQELSKEALEEAFLNLATPTTTQTLTITNNVGSPAAVTLATSGTVSGSTTVTQTVTGALVVGMLVTGTGISDAVAVTMQDAGDTVTRVAHGLANGTEVSFATIVTTTGVVVYTRYYVINTAANTFQVSLTLGGSAIALTTDGSGTLLYGSFIVSINAGVSYVLTAPASATGSVTTTNRALNGSIATLKRWTVTY